MNTSEGNDEIRDIIIRSQPAMTARCDVTEMRCIEEYLNGLFSFTIKREISELLGVFPETDEFLRKFCEYYMECIVLSDVLALFWGGIECKVVRTRCNNNTKFTRLTALEPYYFKQP